MKKNFKSLGSFFVNYLIFFVIIGFVVTCSFLLFFSMVDISPEDIRAFAPAVFFNVLVLTGLFVISDIIRRYVTVDRPARQIQKTLQKLMKGDFTARVPVGMMRGRGTRFKEIGESINHLAEELNGVETLRTDFIANVSHELKTPLAVMQNYGTMLQKPGLTEEKRLEYSKAITETSRRLAGLITNILRLNKLENQQIFPSFTPYDLSEQLCECLIGFEDEWERKSINIETDIDDGVIIESDAELLSIVWNNLISNALKFTPPDGTVAVSLKNQDGIITVRVADTGCGMSSEVGAHIFEKFYQGDTSHASRGNGLGLALVKRVMDIVRGEISVQSAPGKGSIFSVRL